jgi:hypothetical protein
VSHTTSVLCSTARTRIGRVGRRAARRLVPAISLAALSLAALACSAGDRPAVARGAPADASARQTAAPPAGVRPAPASPAPSPSNSSPNSSPNNSTALSAPVAPGAAPHSGQALRDQVLRELGDFRLSKERVDDWGAAQRKLNELTSRNPEILRNMMLLGPPKSLDEMVTRFDSQPGVHEAIADAGLSSREYVLTMLALQQSIQGYFAKKTGRLTTPPAGVTGENIAFVEQHITEIQQLMDELRRMKQEGSQASGVRRQ